MSKEMSNKLKFYSFVMTIFIVIYHFNSKAFLLTFNDSYPFNSFSLNYIYNIFYNFGSLALDFFFAQTAFLLYRDLDKSNYRIKIKKRVMSLLIPFIAWNIICLVLYSILNYNLNFISIRAFVLGFTILPFDGPFWYIFAILIYLLLVPIFLKLKNNKPLLFSFFFVLIFMSIIITLYPPNILSDFTYYYCIERVFRFIPSYCFGIFLSMSGNVQSKILGILNSNNYRYSLIFLVFLVILSFDWCFNIPSIVMYTFSKVRAFLLFCFFNEKWFSSFKLKYLDFSFIIYASHEFVEEFIFRLTSSRVLFPENIIITFSLILFVTILVYFISFFIYTIILKSNKNYLLKKILTGGR